MSAVLPAAGERRIAPGEVALLAAVFVVAACGLVYELAAGALASYLLGDSVLQFSTIIGTYLFAMGVGSYLSRFLERQLVAHFLRIELLVGLIGGFSAIGWRSLVRPRQAQADQQHLRRPGAREHARARVFG